MNKVVLASVLVAGLVMTGCHSHHGNHAQATVPTVQGAPVVQVPVAQVPTKMDYPAIPKYAPAVNSYGQMQVNCKGNQVYYTLTYACYRASVRLSSTVDGQKITPDKTGHTPGPRMVFFEQGHFTKGNAPATVSGVVTGGNPGGTYNKTCR